MGGGEKSLERHVENAEQATNRVVTEQRERVGQAVPVRTGPSDNQESQRRISETVQRVVESMDTLFAQRNTVRQAIGPASREEEYGRAILSIFANPEVPYRSAERGHETPRRTFHGQAEAQAHSNELLQEARSDAPRQESAAPPSPKEEKGFWASLWDGIVSVLETLRDFFRNIALNLFYPVLVARDAISDAIISTNEEITREVTESWLTENYLGPVVRARFARTPPVVTTESAEFFDTLDGTRSRSPDLLGYGPGTSGHYYTGTNHIALRQREPERGAISDPSEADRRRTNVHEQLHYASWLGGGHDMRWRNEHGIASMPRHIEWLHEGLTELHAQQLTRSHGYTPSRVAYPYETATSFYIQQIVGEPVLRSAYLSGDFTEVRRRLDERLGAGTFDRLAGMDDGLEALELITGRMSAAGINFQAWERNPVLAAAYQGIAQNDAVR